jgi:hypothetical protein
MAVTLALLPLILDAFRPLSHCQLLADALGTVQVAYIPNSSQLGLNQGCY